MNPEYKKIKNEIDRTGLLLQTDQVLPSLTGIVAGKPVKGSWWGHPKGNLMYNLSNELMWEKDILTVKLINHKITFIQKRHWDALFAIVSEQSPWQMKGLAVTHKNLLKQVTQNKLLRADNPKLKKTPSEVGKLANKLEERLLLYSEGIHTASGKHVRQLSSWPQIFKLKKFKPKKLSYESAIDHFRAVAEDYDMLMSFPWEK